MPVRDHHGSASCEKHVVLGRRRSASDFAHRVEGLDHLGDRPVAVHKSTGCLVLHAGKACPIIFYMGRVGAVKVSTGRVWYDLRVGREVVGVRHVDDTARVDGNLDVDGLVNGHERLFVLVVVAIVVVVLVLCHAHADKGTVAMHSGKLGRLIPHYLCRVG